MWREVFLLRDKDLETQKKIKSHINMDAGKSCVQVLFLATLALNWSDFVEVDGSRVNKDCERSNASTFPIKW